MHKNPAVLLLGQRELLGFQSLEQRKAALPPLHRQFNPTLPPALPPLPQKSPLALGQPCLCSHTAKAGEAQTKTKPLWGFGSFLFQPDQFTDTVPRVRAAQAQGNRDDKSHFYLQMSQLQTCTSPAAAACASREIPHPCRYTRHL